MVKVEYVFIRKFINILQLSIPYSEANIIKFFYNFKRLH